jgi:hypothetical protein
MTPYHVARSKLFVRERFGKTTLIHLDTAEIEANIEHTRFPVPGDEQHTATDDFPGLLPAWAVLFAIGALVGVSVIRFWPIWIAISMGARLAIVLDRLEAGKSRLPHMTFVLSSASHSEGRGVRKEMGDARQLCRSILRPIALDYSTRRWYVRDAVLAVSIGQFRLSCPQARYLPGLTVVVRRVYAAAQDVACHLAQRARLHSI